MFYRSPVVTSRSDLFPKLVAMQKLVGARNFVVTKAAASGFPNKKKLTCELENWGMNAAEQSAQFIRAVGDILWIISRHRCCRLSGVTRMPAVLPIFLTCRL